MYVDDQGKQKRKVMKTDPLADGTVPESWAASEFSESTVLESWGPGRYRVDFYDSAGDHITGGRVFEVAKPKKGAALPKRGKRRVPTLAGDDDDGDDADGGRRRRAIRADAPLTMMDFLAMQQQASNEAREREDRIADRARQEARDQREADRQFMTTILTATRGGEGGGAVSSDLLRREISLEMREGMSRMRRDLATDLQGGRPGDDDNDDPEDPPKDINEAGNRIVMSILSELENKAPEMLNEAIPTIVGWMRARGMMPSPQLQAEIDAHRAAQNGHGRA
jgi:hypothetical protein